MLCYYARYARLTEDGEAACPREAHHLPDDGNARRELAHCGEAVCPACADVDAYAVLRTERCRRMEAKTSCEKCGNHCYTTDKRDEICAVMRYAGPRMLGKHPVAAVRHLLGR